MDIIWLESKKYIILHLRCCNVNGKLEGLIGNIDGQISLHKFNDILLGCLVDSHRVCVRGYCGIYVNRVPGLFSLGWL